MSVLINLLLLSQPMGSNNDFLVWFIVMLALGFIFIGIIGIILISLFITIIFVLISIGIISVSVLALRIQKTENKKDRKIFQFIFISGGAIISAIFFGFINSIFKWTSPELAIILGVIFGIILGWLFRKLVFLALISSLFSIKSTKKQNNNLTKNEKTS